MKTKKQLKKWKLRIGHDFMKIISTKSQNELILNYLQCGNRLTGLQALEYHGCMRLASRINDLKKAGYSIQGKMIKLKNGKHVKKYWL